MCVFSPLNDKGCTICYNVHQIVVMLDGCRDWYTMPDGIVFIIDRLFSAACAPVRMGISLTFGAQWVLWYKTFSKHFKLLEDPHAGLSRTIKVLFLISCILFHYFGFFFDRVDDRVLNIFREFLALFSYLYQDFYCQAPSFLMCSVTDRKKLLF